MGAMKSVRFRTESVSKPNTFAFYKIYKSFIIRCLSIWHNLDYTLCAIKKNRP